MNRDVSFSTSLDCLQKKCGGSDEHLPHNLYSDCQLPLVDYRLPIGYRISIRRNDSNLKSTTPEIASIPDCEFTKLLRKGQAAELLSLSLAKTILGNQADRISTDKKVDSMERPNCKEQGAREKMNNGKKQIA